MERIQRTRTANVSLYNKLCAEFGIGRYVEDLLKEFVGGDMLYFLSVCTEEERTDAIGIMKIICGDCSDYSAIGNNSPSPIQLSKEIEHASDTTITTVGVCLAMKEDLDGQTCICKCSDDAELHNASCSCACADCVDEDREEPAKSMHKAAKSVKTADVQIELRPLYNKSQEMESNPLSGHTSKVDEQKAGLEAQVAELKKELGLASLQSETDSALAAQVRQLQKQAAENQQQLSDAISREEALKRQQLTNREAQQKKAHKQALRKQQTASEEAPITLHVGLSLLAVHKQGATV